MMLYPTELPGQGAGSPSPSGLHPAVAPHADRSLRPRGHSHPPSRSSSALLPPGEVLRLLVPDRFPGWPLHSPCCPLTALVLSPTGVILSYYFIFPSVYTCLSSWREHVIEVTAVTPSICLLVKFHSLILSGNNVSLALFTDWFPPGGKSAVNRAEGITALGVLLHVCAWGCGHQTRPVSGVLWWCQCRGSRDVRTGLSSRQDRQDKPTETLT